MREYKFVLDNFEGPLELLMHLIEKHKIDIYDIPIVEITSQYMEKLDEWNKFDISYSSEFLVMAATLLQIKSKMLLPKVEKAEQEDIEDPRDVLVARLLEFKKIKKIAKDLDERIKENSTIFSRPEELSQLGVEAHFDLRDIPFYDVFYKALNAIEEEKELINVVVEKEKFTMEDATKQIFDSLRKDKLLHYERFIYKYKSKIKLITIFLALLELLKMQLIDLELDDYDEILIREV